MLVPANTNHLYTIYTTSAQRLRRWSNIVEMLYKCFVLAGVVAYVEGRYAGAGGEHCRMLGCQSIT